MDDTIINHQILNENFIVQPLESIPISVLDYNKIEVPQLVQPGQLPNGTSVIQLTDLNSNLKSKVLHPLEAEIQRDFELKQQQEALAKHPATSVIRCSNQSGQDQFTDKTTKILETTNPILESVLQLQIPNGRDSVLNINSSEPDENVVCQTPPVNRQMVVEKRHYIIVSDGTMLYNITPKDSKLIHTDINTDIVKTNELIDKADVPELPLLLDKYENNNDVCKDINLESDSENEEDNLEPVYDYEPDPELPAKNNEQIEKPNKCYMCFRSFRQKKNMYAHIRKIHSTQPKIEGGILCPLCKMHALRQEHLRNHLQTLHDIHIEKEEKLFNTMEEFLTWKEFMEKDTLSFYVSKSSSKLLANNQQKTYYKCHRSGNYITHTKENRKKKLKVQGSNKIGATCPAAMEVTENIHGINVIFWKTHVGHENDLAHLVLSKEDRVKIMDFLASGASWDKVLENIRKEETKTSLTPSRLAIVSKQDLRNIKKIHEMKTSPELFASRKKIVQGRKPIKERMLRRASQALVIEKADALLNLLKTTDVRPEFRPKICLMIDNLISTIKRRAVKIPKREIQKRRQWSRPYHADNVEERRDRPEDKSPTNSSKNFVPAENVIISNIERNVVKDTLELGPEKRLHARKIIKKEFSRLSDS